MQTIASKARSVWRLLLSRTSFCAAFLCLSLIRFVDNTLYWNVLRYLMFPWGAALAYPLLTLHNLPRNRGMVFAFAFFIWYFIVSYVNRKHSFYQNAYDWFLILFSLFIFYPQDRSLPFASLKLRMQVHLYVRERLWDARQSNMDRWQSQYRRISLRSRSAILTLFCDRKKTLFNRSTRHQWHVALCVLIAKRFT